MGPHTHTFTHTRPLPPPPPPTHPYTCVLQGRRRGARGSPTTTHPPIHLRVAGAEARRPWIREFVTKPWEKKGAAAVAGASTEAEPGAARHALAAVTESGAGAGSSAGSSAGRMRPLIYVYDLPAAYNSRMLQ